MQPRLWSSLAREARLLQGCNGSNSYCPLARTASWLTCFGFSVRPRGGWPWFLSLNPVPTLCESTCSRDNCCSVICLTLLVGSDEVPGCISRRSDDGGVRSRGYRPVRVDSMVDNGAASAASCSRILMWYGRPGGEEFAGSAPVGLDCPRRSGVAIPPCSDPCTCSRILLPESFTGEMRTPWVDCSRANGSSSSSPGAVGKVAVIRVADPERWASWLPGLGCPSTPVSSRNLEGPDGFGDSSL
jgi:hypothetical protein